MKRIDDMKVADIKEQVSKSVLDDWEWLSIELEKDSRSAVQKMGLSLKNKLKKHQMEIVRLQNMVKEEQFLAECDGVVCGVDEAGRGPLAGPVVAAAVILPKDFLPIGLDDSKKIPEPKREELYSQIVENALAWGIGIVSPERIDEINILEATKEAMIMAVKELKIRPDMVLIDAVQLKKMDILNKGIIKGDARCLSIAAASIIAKVSRDRIMKTLGEEDPRYGYEIHKGYGTAKHYEALSQYGLSPYHRRSFLKGFR